MFLRRSIPHLVFLAVVASMALTCIWVIYRLHQPVSPVDLKMSEADRISYYLVTHTSGPKFQLGGTERVIKVISHAVLQGTEPYDPRRRVGYGLRVRIIKGDRVFWQHDTFIDTRQSKAVRLDEIWLRENTFTTRRGMELTDDRVLVVHLPEDTPADSMLEITLLGEPQSALIRVYERELRTAEERETAVQGLRDSFAEAMVERSTYAPWALMSEEDRHQRMSHRYLRMPAVGEPGVDFQTRSLFYTGFRLPLEELTAEEGLWLDDRRAAALNVVGPTTLEISLDRPSQQELLRMQEHGGRRASAIAAAGPTGNRARQQDGVLRIRSISEVDDPPAWALPLPGLGAGTTHSIEIPAGLHSLRIDTSTPVPVRAEVAGPPHSQFGAIPYLDHPEGGRRLVPDERRFAVYETGPRRLPVIAGIFVPEDPRARIMRIDARVVMPEAADGSPVVSRALPAATLSLEFLDEEDQTILVETHEVEAPFTPFEHLDRARGSDGEVAEAVGIRVIAPEGADKIRVTASDDVALRFYRYLPSPVLYQPPYRNVELSRNHWRYAPRDRRNWFPATPLNAAVLSEELQRSILVAQVRLEPRQRHKRSGKRYVDAVAVTPRGRPERHQILEPVPPERTAVVARTWPPGALARLEANRPTRFRFADPSRSRIDYAVPEDQLGKMLAVHVDGQPLARFRLTASRGYWNLPRVEHGEHEIALVTEASGADFYLDRPPAVLATTRLFRRRTVYALDAAPLEIAVRKVPGQRVYVTMVTYAPAAASEEDIQIRAVIGGGVPLRVPGKPFSKLTVAERVVPLPEPRYPHTAMLAGVAGQQAGQPRYLTIPLSDDLVPGTHMIGFASVGAPRMWARFFVTHQDEQSEDRVLQWRFRASEAESDGDGDADDDASP